MSTLGNLLVSLFGLSFCGSFFSIFNSLHSVTHRVLLDSAAIAVVAPHGNR